MIKIYWQKCRKVLRYYPSYRFLLLFLLLLILVSFLVFLLPLNPNKIDVTQLSQGPSLKHLFGTDELGRDYFLRVLYGGHISLTVGFVAMATATILGTAVGLLSGYFGGILDSILMRLVDVLSSIPWMVLSIVLSVLLEPGIGTVILVISLFSWMNISRLVRGEAISFKERDYVLYSQFIGEKSWKIIFQHLLPPILPTILVAATTNLSSAIMTESALSFLGLGIQQPKSSWGSLLENAQSNLQGAPHMALIPGIFIILTVLAFNGVGEFLRKIFSDQE
ncbi:ABC transporter permease [Enterococcus alishanensis]|uniref:ABC transporter permease n=1 Tax=Enterococcus alishanensis TaxID=1303817 RepID=A0ABS6T8Y7_9ENTE|nr:ABC transporter permease [Enterococcus alishanensis]MBV7389364.1 ABC transporter permease [Enterococcus alishanensis]